MDPGPTLSPLSPSPIVSQYFLYPVVSDLRSSVRGIIKATTLSTLLGVLVRAQNNLEKIRVAVTKTQTTGSPIIVASSFLEPLPLVLLTQIFEFLPLCDLLHGESVSKTWRSALSSNTAANAWKIAYIVQEWGASSKVPLESPLPWRDRVYNRLALDRSWMEGKCSRKSINHGDIVWALSFKQDILITAGNDHQLKIWNTQPQRAFWTHLLSGHTDAVRAVKLYEQLVISGSYDSTIKIWNLDGNCLRTLEGHTGCIWSVAPEGNKLVSASEDKLLKIWDLETGICQQTLKGHNKDVNSVGVVNNHIVSGSDDTTIKEWAMQSEECVRTLSGHTSSVYAVTVDERRIVSGSVDHTIRIWDPQNGKCSQILRGHDNGIRCLSVDGRRIVSGGSDKTVKIWRLRKEPAVKTLTEHKDWVIAIECDSKRLISGDDSGIVVIRDFDE